MPSFAFTFQESSPLIAYSAGWDAVDDSNDPFKGSYNGIFRPTSKAGTTATLSFLGTGVSIFGAKRDNHGNYSVELDGSQPAFIGDGFAPQPFIFNSSLWSSPELPYSQHTVKLTNIPTKSGTWVDIDYITIQRSIGGPDDQIFNLTLDDSPSAFVNYIGSWQPIPQNTAFNNTLHRTAAAGAQVVIQFRGCCIEVYGQYANANFTAKVDDQTPITLNGFDANLPDAIQQPRTLLFLMDGLDEGATHKVTLRNLDQNDFRPLYFDYAVVRSTHSLSAVDPTQNATTRPKKNVPIAAIVAPVVGVIALLLLLILIYYLVRRRKRSAVPAMKVNGVNVNAEPFIVPHANPNRNTQSSKPVSTLHTSFTGTSDHPTSTGQSSNQSSTVNLAHPPPTESLAVPGLDTYSPANATITHTPPVSTYSHTAVPLSSTASTSVVRSDREDKGSTISAPVGTAEPIRERDAGAIIVQDSNGSPSRLPPAYDPTWAQTSADPS
jgi:hypothetical protein